MKLSLKERLVNFLLKYHEKEGWIPSGELQRIVAQKTSYTPRTTCRRLEELVVEGKLEVKYIKGHAWYKARLAPEAPKMPPNAIKGEDMVKAMLLWFDALPGLKREGVGVS